MKYHAIFGSALLACVSPFNTGALAQDCRPLKQVADIQMLTSAGGYRELVPVTVNGTPRLMILDTEGYASQISDATAKELQMPLRDSTLTFSSISGKKTQHYVSVDSIQLGSVLTERQAMIVFPSSDGSLDGDLANDVMLHYDMDIDFGAGRLKYFSADHCPGKIVYWSPPAVAAIPVTIEDLASITIQVKLDGQTVKAKIATGATRSIMTMDAARKFFGLTPQSAGVEKAGNVNDNPKLPALAHTFHTLSFGGVDVSNLQVLIIPDRSNDGGRLGQPDLMIGMDILRHLHIYLAVEEKILYVSAGSPPRAPVDEMAWLDEAVAASPTNPGLRNTRCFARAFRKENLAGALEDCEVALKARPQSVYFTDSKGFVLYQLGRYKDALDTYNQALLQDPRHAASLYVRGHAKKKLGDATGGDADIAAAKALSSTIEGNFKDARLTD